MTRLTILAVFGLLGCHQVGSEASPDAAQGVAVGDSATFQPAAHTPFPQIPRHAGPIVNPFRLVTITAANDALTEKLDAFGAVLVTSQWLATVGAEYGVNRATTLALTGPAITAGTAANPVGFTEAQTVTYINTLLMQHPEARPDGHTIYLVYLPDGVVFKYAGIVNADCSIGTGYHDSAPNLSTLGDALASVQRCPMLTADPRQETPLDLLTSVASHEVLESATDPSPALLSFNPNPMPAYDLFVPGTAAVWTADPWINVEDFYGNLEIGDLCMGTRIVEQGFAVQRIFSSQAASGAPCIPAREPFYNVTDPERWYAIAAGGSMTIPLTAWSTAPRSEWLLQALGNNSRTDATYRMRITLDSATTTTVAGVTYATTNNGRVSQLTVQMPSAAPSGWAGTILVTSFDTDAEGYTPAGDDYDQQWVIGVYVP
jgi:hypothetical protein